MRLMIAGDTHGSLQQMGFLFREAIEFDIDRIFVCGDFGYWEHTPAGVTFLEKLDEVAGLAGVPVYWLDGNHENHTLLRSSYRKRLNNEGFWTIRPNIFYSPRGHRFEWEGVKFLTLGGAWSIDGPDSPVFPPNMRRRKGRGWWPEETITDAEVAACGTDKVDIMLTHDLPTGIDMQAIMAARGVNYTYLPESESNRVKVREVVDAVKPDYLFHGHYHVYYKKELVLDDGHVTVVQGLGCDGYGRQSYTVVDLAA